MALLRTLFGLYYQISFRPHHQSVNPHKRTDPAAISRAC